jgi:antibiotic biosynthesis monooxygenase (ABM) superfamily enzyme
MGFPKVIFVTKDLNSKKGEDFLAWPREIDAIVQDGPTEIGHYILVETRHRKKQVETVREIPKE